MRFNEVKKKMSAKDDPCWSGYHMVGTKTKNGREVPNCVPGKKGVSESAEAVKQAIANRIMRQHVDLVSRVGPEALISAIDAVGDSVGDVEEIGTSDVSAWVNTVKQHLSRRMAGESRVKEGHDKSHGSPYDRGSADRYYGRQPNPHKGGVGGGSGPMSTDLTREEVAAYMAGYHEETDRKQWESVELEEDWRKALASMAVAGSLALGALTPSHAADAPQAPIAATQVAPDSADPADAAKMKLNIRPSIKRQAAGDDTVSPDDAAQTQLKLRPSIKRPAAEATDTMQKPAAKKVDPYISMLVYKLQNDKPMSQREREDLRDYLKKIGVKTKESATEAMKLSDLPPTMRRKLTMKDIEAERPKGAFRYRVGDKEFMSLDAAKEFAAGTNQKVQVINWANPENESKEVDERKLSAHELERREEIVKGMKKAKGDFEKRYGSRAKEVMYATATKMAKNEDINERRRLAADEGHYYCEAEREVKPIPEGYVKVAGGYIMKKI